ncbi:endonuclease III [Peptoniphilaceae bacterium SGI.131]
MARKYRLNKKEKIEVINKILDFYPDAGPELNFTNPFELLIATILSAQTTDVQVNKVTKNLFLKYPTCYDLAKADVADVMNDIKTIGLYKDKAKRIVATSNLLISDFGGEVPKTMEELTTLPGVGRKTANVVMANAFFIPAIAVDTHVFRVSNRLGLANADNVEDTEEDLKKAIPKEKWADAHHGLIFHGRRICSARNPKCHLCPVSDLCIYYGKLKNERA